MFMKKLEDRKNFPRRFEMASAPPPKEELKPFQKRRVKPELKNLTTLSSAWKTT